MGTYRTHINGIARSVASSDPDKPLLYALRNLGFTAAKFGSDLGQCGACNVLVDGRATRSCVETIPSSQEKSVVTLEGLGSMTAPHPVQVALIKEQVPRALWRWY
jgi:nicotinate dehydrogenase subunit A